MLQPAVTRAAVGTSDRSKDQASSDGSALPQRCQTGQALICLAKPETGVLVKIQTNVTIAISDFERGETAQAGNSVSPLTGCLPSWPRQAGHPMGHPSERKGRAGSAVGQGGRCCLQPLLLAAVTVPCQLRRKEAGMRDTANLGTVTLGDTGAQQPNTAASDTAQNFPVSRHSTTCRPLTDLFLRSRIPE